MSCTAFVIVDCWGDVVVFQTSVSVVRSLAKSAIVRSLAAFARVRQVAWKSNHLSAV